MTKQLLLVLVLCASGCAFDSSLLRGRDSGTVESDAVMVDAFSMEDAPEDAPAIILADAGVDSPDAAVTLEDSPDAFRIIPEDVGVDAGPVLTCTDLPSLSGNYSLNTRLRGCGTVSYGDVPFIRTGACTYEVDDGNPLGSQLFDGPCTVVIMGSDFILECDAAHFSYHFSCIVTPVSGGLNVTCRYSRGIPAITDPPCSFFMPQVSK